MKCLRIYISGVVQGVGMRYFIKTEASSMGLVGWVRNLDDGRVEIVVKGDREKLDEFLKICRRGSPFAQVEQVDVQEIDCRSFDFTESFEIKY